MLSEPLIGRVSKDSSCFTYSMLALSIAFEVGGTLCMKLSVENAWWRMSRYGGYAICISIFPFVLRSMSLGIAYATWSSLGTLSVVLLSRVMFDEHITCICQEGVLGNHGECHPSRSLERVIFSAPSSQTYSCCSTSIRADRRTPQTNVLS